MPFYDYQCQACSYEFEVKQGVKAPKKKKCPECGKYKLEIIIGNVFGHGSPTTLLGQAEKNTKALGRYELEDKSLEQKKSKKSSASKLRDIKGVKQIASDVTHNPWYGTAPESIKKDIEKADVGKVKDISDLPPKIEKYIMTGET